MYGGMVSKRSGATPVGKRGWPSAGIACTLGARGAAPGAPFGRSAQATGSAVGAGDGAGDGRQRRRRASGDSVRRPPASAQLIGTRPSFGPEMLTPVLGSMMASVCREQRRLHCQKQKQRSEGKQRHGMNVQGGLVSYSSPFHVHRSLCNWRPWVAADQKCSSCRKVSGVSN